MNDELNHELCWICNGQVANSKEHKFKASDIRSLYGRVFTEKLIFKRGNQDLFLQGVNSELIKHETKICTDCNNNKTQQADGAYDTFISCIPNKFEEYKSKKVFDFIEIYGKNWEFGKNNLLRYFAKQAGCRINAVDSNLIPANLSNFILGKEANRSLKLKFIQKEGIEILKLLMKDENFMNISNGATAQLYWKGKHIFHGWFFYDWLMINWFCGENILNENGLDSHSSIEYEPLNIDGRKDEDNLLNWIEYYNIETGEKRRKFILSNV